MPSVFRRGKRWYARFKDADGKWAKEAGFTDKTATLQLAVRREHEADLVRKGLAEAPQPKSERLIDEDLKAFRSALANKEVSEDQVALVVGRCERLIAGCEFPKVGNIDAVSVEDWLAKQRKGTKKKKGISVQTSNHYLRAIKQFTRWLSRHKRLRDDPLTHVEMLNVAVDRRHDRRALSEDETARLLTTTFNGRTVLGMPAKERHMLYVMALSTGLRASELGSLKKESLSLETNPPTVRVKAGYSKRRRLDVLPIPSAMLAAAREWLKGKKAGESLWPGSWAKNRCAGKMLQVDLKAAGIDYQDADGLFADFHALRHTYITNLARQGVPLTTAQKLARHSTPVLTAARYTHIEIADQHREVEKLSPLIGTNMGQTRGISCPKSSSDGNEASDEAPGEKCKNPQKSEGFCETFSGEAGIRTLGRVNPSPVFKTDPDSTATAVTTSVSCEKCGCSGALSGTNGCQFLATVDVDLLAVIEKWSQLHPSIRKGIVALLASR
ncbi:MAG: site-specific integrase [Planctomycetaceae bacterium]|nr:site-specific integrase [Planctomycetaceae bacterium]